MSIRPHLCTLFLPCLLLALPAPAARAATTKASPTAKSTRKAPHKGVRGLRVVRAKKPAHHGQTELEVRKDFPDAMAYAPKLYGRTFLVGGMTGNRKLVRTFNKRNGAGPVNRMRRMRMAAIMVKKSMALRTRGLTIPQMSIADANPEYVIQDFASGEKLEALDADAMRVATAEMNRYLAIAEQLAAADRGSFLKADWLVNSDRDAFRFNRDGTISAWADPVIPMSAKHYNDYQPRSR